MFDLREHKGLIRRLVSEANKNDANLHWSLKALSKTKASIFWSYLDTEKVYLLNIMQADKADHKVRGLPGLKKNIYTDILTNRGSGWHLTDAAHSETAFEHIMWVDENKNVECTRINEVS